MQTDHLISSRGPDIVAIIKRKMNLLIYMSDIKLFAKNDKELETNARSLNIQ